VKSIISFYPAGSYVKFLAERIHGRPVAIIKPRKKEVK